MKNNSGVMHWPSYDPQAVKTYSLLRQAGYYYHFTLDWKGYTLIWAIKPKNKS